MGGAGYLTKGRGGFQAERPANADLRLVHMRGLLRVRGSGESGRGQGTEGFVGPENLASKVPLSVRWPLQGFELHLS